MEEFQSSDAKADFSEPEQVEELWQRYYPKLRSAVRQRVRDIRRAVGSESEVAHSALRTFLRRAQEGEFSEVKDENELWRLLKTIAIRKTTNMRRKLRAQKRGGDEALYNQADLSDDQASGEVGVAGAAGSDPSPENELEVSEVFNALLDELPDDRYRDLILLKLQGASVAMIADHLSTTTRTVQRMVKRVEQDWSESFLGS